MNKPIIKRWIKALRSGEYKKTKGYLHDDEGFCCLGVLCDIELDSYWHKGASTYQTVYHIEDLYYELPDSLSERAGLTATQEQILMGMNDGDSTFEEIADWLEKKINE